MRSFVKIKSSRNGKITLSFVNMTKSCPSREFIMLQICLNFNAICENKILPKISEFTVHNMASVLFYHAWFGGLFAFITKAVHAAYFVLLSYILDFAKQNLSIKEKVWKRLSLKQKSFKT